MKNRIKMPEQNKRRFQFYDITDMEWCWQVIDTIENKIVYKSMYKNAERNYRNASLISFILNKKYYNTNKII